MSLLGPHSLAVVLCKCSDQPLAPQPPTFFRALFTLEDPRQWAAQFEISNPGGEMASPPGAGVAVVARFADHLDVFWVGSDGGVWNQWWDFNYPNGAWDKHPPLAITGPNVTKPGAAVAAVARRPDHLDVFWVDNEGAIGTTWWDADPNGGWNNHTPFRITATQVAPPGGALAVVARRPEHLDVFWADNSGAIGTTWWDADPNGGWDKHTPFRISDQNVALPGTSVAAVARYPDHLDVFWYGTDGAVWNNWWDVNGPWAQHSALRITPIAQSAPRRAGIAAVARHPNHLDVFWTGDDGAVWNQWWDSGDPNGGWDKHSPLPISARKSAFGEAGVAAAARYPDHLDVFWAGADGAVWTNWWDLNLNGGQWNPPFPITIRNSFPREAKVAALSRYPEHLDVFWADNSHAIGTNFWPSASPWGLAQYWRDMSYGQFSLDGTIFGWYTMGATTAQFLALSRDGKIGAGLAVASAAGVPVSDYYTAVVIPNVISDSGTSNGKSVLDPLAWTLGWAAHETGHDLGLDHSFDDNPGSCDPSDDGRPGAYGDGWDIMSFACFGGINPQFSTAATFGPSGPALNAPYRDALGWLPANRILAATAGNAFRQTITLAALNHLEANGYLMVKLYHVPSDRSTYYTLEFRRQEGWDQGIPHDAVLIHLVKNGLSYLIKAQGGPERLPPDQYIDSSIGLSIRVQKIDIPSSTATVEIALG